jgi:hypothetical protein
MSRTSASEHVHLMEERIRGQLSQIEKLRLEGSDLAQAIKRLNLLQHALEEMRAQLGSLLPTLMDDKRDQGQAHAPPRPKK